MNFHDTIQWVIPKKIHPPPPLDGWGRFLPPPLSPRFPEAQEPPSFWISKTKDPPPSGLLGLDLISFQ